jgi:hypothetical protein
MSLMEQMVGATLVLAILEVCFWAGVVWYMLKPLSNQEEGV